ncbi:GGDEF domain-containing protein [Modestobacter sp. Leaf380]|uniref:GGDEF domain-containing protein n=1 Tax=Modestobacter sp. Leaf380 TaxID=1736356 RepID=UPI001F3D7779|nr:GGDEF domain-containing protein [Modestobacter sp. Leaf380]
MTTGTPALVDDAALAAARWALLEASDREDARAFVDSLAEVEVEFAEAGTPRWTAWSHAFTARRLLVGDEVRAAGDEVAAARAAAEACPADAERALVLAYLAHLEVSGDRFDAALHLAVDASLLTDQVPADQPSRELHQAHHWLSLALTRLDLEELAVAQALRGQRVASALADPADCWRLLRLCAQQHAELAQTVHRRGDDARAARLAAIALRCSFAASDLDWEPPEAEADLLAVVHAWALTLADDLDGTLPALRRVRGRVEATGGLWLLGYADLALARLLTRTAAHAVGPALAGVTADPAAAAAADEATDLLVAAAGAFAAVGDHRRHRQCLLELGQTTAQLGRAAEALHWLEAYRADASRMHLRGRELWAEMFVRRSRLREAERQAAVARRHALEDPLTGLGNRRSAERRLGELDLATRPLSLAVVDVDRFKTVNDDNSHLHGDAVLRRLAELLRLHCRTGDQVFRWAGDEFLVLLPDATEAQAVLAMERLRHAVVHCDWSELGIADPVTVSIGIATSHPGTAGSPGTRTWREVFDSADLHLFTAKRAGRDRVRTGAPTPADASPGSTRVPSQQAGAASSAAGTPRAPQASVDQLVADLLGARVVRPSGWAFDVEDEGAP